MRSNPLRDNSPYLVVIPWRREGGQGHELELAVAGWHRHCLNNITVVVVGEDDPQLDGVVYIRSERVPAKEGQYRQHLDYVKCFKAVRKAFPESEGFVFVADDVYAVHDFDMTDVVVLKNYGGEITSRPDSPNAWQRDKAKTKARLLAEGYPVINYTTHLPQWYEWDLLEALWEKYDMENESYLMEDLYFNIYYGDRLAVNVRDEDVNESNIYLRGVYHLYYSPDKIREAFKNKIWINNSIEGWSTTLGKMLAEYYGL